MPPLDARDDLAPDADGFFRALVDLTHDLVFTADRRRADHVRQRRRAARAALRSAASCWAAALLEIVREDWRDAVADVLPPAVRAAASRDTYYELPALTRSGTTVWLGVHVRVARRRAGRTVRSEARRATSRTGAASRRRCARARSATARRSTRTSPASTSSAPTGQIRTCNPAFVRIYGFPSLIDALGSNLATLYRAGDRSPPWSIVCAATGRSIITRPPCTAWTARSLHVIESLVGALRRSRGPRRGQRLCVRRHAAQGPRGPDAAGAEDGGARPPRRRRGARLQQHPDGHQRPQRNRARDPRRVEPGPRGSRGDPRRRTPGRRAHRAAARLQPQAGAAADDLRRRRSDRVDGADAAATPGNGRRTRRLVDARAEVDHGRSRPDRAGGAQPRGQRARRHAARRHA